jgi:hypothetical protein
MFSAKMLQKKVGTGVGSRWYCCWRVTMEKVVTVIVVVPGVAGLEYPCHQR